MNYIQELQILSKKFPINPLSIVDDERINSEHNIPNISGYFKNDFMVNISLLKRIKSPITWNDIVELLVYQTIDSLLEYRKNCFNFLPMSIVQQVKNQMKEAVSYMRWEEKDKSFVTTKFDSLLDSKLFRAGIIEETMHYMNRINLAKNV
ncbi:MAG: hypothetical protein MJ198_00255 [Bacteroidales bacterium]|nr:hypothetical protein [Bacteroidales bacterium]